MSTEPTDIEGVAEPQTPAAENAYLVIGLAAVVVLGVALVQTGVGRWSVVPTLIGAAGLAFRWRSAPLVLLAAVALTQLGLVWMYGPGSVALNARGRLPVELSLCGATLAYVMAQYRLFGLTGSVFPADARRPLDQPPPRDAARVPASEAPVALVTVAAATVGVFFLWQVIVSMPPALNIRPTVWEAGLLIWLAGGALVLAAGVIGQLGWRRLSPDEAELYLRDVLWQETRGEQRRIHRWRAWALRRRERKSSGSGYRVSGSG
jgi:hypothetical protein